MFIDLSLFLSSLKICAEVKYMSRIHRTNKYDLMGLLREELKKKSLLQIHTQDNLMTTQLKEVSAAGLPPTLIFLMVKNYPLLFLARMERLIFFHGERRV